MQCVIHGSCTVCAHPDTFWPGYIMFTEKIVDHFKKSLNFFYLQAAAYRIEIPPASHFGRQITKKLKAERLLTHRWIHLIVVQKNLPLGVLRLVVPSAANSSIGRALGCFSVFLRRLLILPKHCFAHIAACWQYSTFRNYVWLFGLSDR